MKLTQLFLCAAALALPLTANAAAKKNNDRWFEIEVVLFNQLGDKSLLKEQFTEPSSLPKYRRVVDILAPYLNPEISNLKQLLPNCDIADSRYNLAYYEAKLPSLFNEKSLSDIDEMATNEYLITESIIDSNLPNAQFNDGTSTFSSPENKQQLAETASDNVLSPEEIAKAQSELQTIIDAAEEAFQALKFDYTPTLNSSLLCQIPRESFAEHQQIDSEFKYNGYRVDKIPLHISATELPLNNQTHLLNDASLKLQDVIRDLRRSKNFKPLLHVGWRQVARAKNKAVAVKMYAGDNFEAHYQQQLSAFEHLIEQEKINQDSLPTALPTLSEEEQAQLDAEQAILAQQQKIRNIVEGINQIPAETEALLSTIDNDLLTIENEQLNADENTLSPQKPIQPWFLEGFFNVHLKHYLFITADFNVLDKTLAQLSTAQLAQSATDNKSQNDMVTAKPIRFKQNRRVISGEVHYFDHPYIGMIVQIRPYKKPTQEE